MIKKMRVRHNGSNIMILEKLDRDETINQKEVELLNTKIIRGIMRPTVMGINKLSYICPEGITLEKYVRAGLTKNDFFLVVAQVLEVIKSVDRNNLNINNLVLDINGSYINEKTKAINFVYQPIVSPRSSTNIFSFLYDISYSTSLALNEDVNCINDMVTFMRSMRSFSVIEFEKYILRVYPEVYTQIKRQKPGQSEMLNGKDMYYHRNEWEEKVERQEKEQSSLLTPMPEVADEDDEDTSLLVEDESANDVQQTDVNIQSPNMDGPTMPEEEDENTSLLVEEQAPMSQADQTVSSFDEDEGTALLSDDLTTGAYLLRLSNYDRIDLNKPSFRIGKEKSYVDYFISNNNAVSRIHCDIIKRGSSFFIKDNNSTNRTFINGDPIQPNMEVEIRVNDVIMLGNEKFEFHID
ncbi:MAG: FHA domain-containing protein [Eubacterium sp.]|nr:FHA domain-containing protein [Eubacterium sp.]